MLLITQPYLLTGGFQLVLKTSGWLCTPGLLSFHEESGVFCGEDQSVRIWKIFVDMCVCTSFKAVVLRAFTFRLLGMG